MALLEPYEHHGRFQEDLDETVKLLGPFDLPSLRPHQSLCLSPSKSVSTLLACLSSPPSIHLFTCWHLGVGTPPGCQIARRAPRPRLASSFLLLEHSTPGNNAHSVPLSFPLISPGLRAKLEPLSLSPPPPTPKSFFISLPHLLLSPAAARCWPPLHLLQNFLPVYQSLLSAFPSHLLYNNTYLHPVLHPSPPLSPSYPLINSSHMANKQQQQPNICQATVHSGVFPHSLMQWLIGFRNWFGVGGGNCRQAVWREGGENREGWRWMPKRSRAGEQLQADNSSCAAAIARDILLIWHFINPTSKPSIHL